MYPAFICAINLCWKLKELTSKWFAAFLAFWVCHTPFCLVLDSWQRVESLFLSLGSETLKSCEKVFYGYVDLSCRKWAWEGVIEAPHLGNPCN